MMFPASYGDFQLGDTVHVSHEELLSDPSWTLYCLDHQRLEALFVRTPQNLDLTKESFLFQGQFEYASELAGVDFSVYQRLASGIRLDSDRIIFVHSVGRCGSTLVSQVFQAIDGVCSVSEPDPPTQVTEWRTCSLLDERELQKLLEASIRFYCKPWAGRATDDRWAFKFRAQCIEIADMLMRLFPDAVQLFINREPDGWIESIFRTFVDPQEVNSPEYARLLAEVWAQRFPLIQKRCHEGNPLSPYQTWMLVWIAVKTTQEFLKRSGHRFVELNYEKLKSDPEGLIGLVLHQCGIVHKNWKPIRECLRRDSQSGTTIAKDKVRERGHSISKKGREEALSMLWEFGWQENDSHLCTEASG